MPRAQGSLSARRRTLLLHRPNITWVYVAVCMGIEALCAAPPEAPSLQVGPVAAVGVGHLRIVRHLLV